MIGTRLAHYEINSHLGTGGMGEVYQATDTKLGRNVAIKLLPEAFASDVERLARFRREAQVLASLNHPNIAHIYGLEEFGETLCIVMELVDGETLQERIHRGPVPVDEALTIAKQIAEALEAAHEKGVIHRDLKPGNVMIKTDGKVKVLDFGLAKAYDTNPSGGTLSNSPTMGSMAATNAGVLLGTAAYMPPEQAKGRPVDKRADIWAFGVVVYEMLTGRPLFKGEDIGDTLAAVLRQEIDYGPLPDEARLMLQRCLERDPAKRLRDIADAVPLLGARLHAEVPSGRERQHDSLKVRWIWPVGLALCVLALAVVSYVHFRGTVPELPLITTSILPPPNTNIDYTNMSGTAKPSPDSKKIVLATRSADGKTQLWVRLLDAESAQPLAGTAGATFPFWAPDSRYVGFFADNKLKKIDTTGGPPVTLVDIQGAGFTGAWSSIGVIVFGTSGRVELQRVSASGGQVTPATAAEKGDRRQRTPWFLPDGMHFLYSAWQNAGENVIRLASIDDGQPGPGKALLKTTGNAIYSRGHLLFLRDHTLFAQPFDLKALSTTGEPLPVAEGVVVGEGTPVTGAFSASEGGLLLYQGGAAPVGQKLTWFDRAGNMTGTFGELGTFGNIAFSPDQKSLLVTLSDGANDLWIYDVSRSLKARFTFDPANEPDGVWTPDGSMIIFRSGRQGPGDLFRKRVDGTGTEELLYADSLSKRPAGITPDGKFLLYQTIGAQGTNDVNDLMILPLTPEPPSGALRPRSFLKTPFNEREAQLSFDGHWVAYVSNETKRSEVYVTPFPGPGSKRPISIAGGVQPRWRRDGKEIYYIAPDGKLMAAEVSIKGAVLETGKVTPLFGPITTNRGYLYEVSEDGQKFLVAAEPQQQSSSPLTLVQNWTALLKK